MKRIFVFLFCFTNIMLASDHGIYLKTLQNVPGSIEEAVTELTTNLQAAGYDVLSRRQMATPDLIHKKSTDNCGYRAFLLVSQKSDYTEYVTTFGNKYLVAAFLKVGIYETGDGIQVNIADPETINRIVFNDLSDSEYDKVISGILSYKTNLISTIHKLKAGGKIQMAQEPVRSAKDLRKANKDMFMMVGPMTFFRDEDQFPLIYSEKVDKSMDGVHDFLGKVKKNLTAFMPDKKDVDYQWTPDAPDLNWELISTVYATDSTAVLLGLSRSRTEALSFKIAGQPREGKENSCPGIDHICAYPIEVLIYQENDKLIMRSAREMFRMDMYFWDAGKMAFMEYMNMPKMLDKSLKQALLGAK